ncbi:Transcription elongation factor spt4 [Cucumispora dikerogammari]|nr:Transcription elongation factor spt4 [Cucumispora dikerogammari]
MNKHNQKHTNTNNNNKEKLISLTLPSILLSKKISKHLSCLGCNIILPSNVFKENGCFNCKFPLYINYCKYTTTKYKNFLVVYNCINSWVAKWKGGVYVNGVYGLNVVGELDDECKEFLGL